MRHLRPAWAGAVLALGTAVAGCAASVQKVQNETLQAACPAVATPERPLPQFGCANVGARALMAAEPRHLVEGGPLGPASGAREAAVVDAYRDWKPGGSDGMSSPLQSFGPTQGN